jgi:hypothetical protein
MAILVVGPGQQFTSIRAAVTAASAGDTIDVQAGIYTNDFVEIFKNLTLQAVGGVVHMVATVDPPNGKAIIEEGGTGIAVTINGFDISGAVVPDGNGAAVRYDGGSLTLNNDYLHNNQDGLLCAADPAGSITINNSEVAFNGVSGLTHNLYIGRIANFTLSNSYIHDVASDGHEVKSRAANNVITDNRIFDNGSIASYSIDLPNGGNADIEGNIIQQGPNSENQTIITYGEEGSLQAGTNVLIANNTIVNDRNGAIGVRNLTAHALTLQNNSVYGLTSANLTSGPATVSGTSFLAVEPSLNTSSTWDVGIACFAAGTKIATPGREKWVEELAVGDLVHTVLLPGEEQCARPVRWVGRRRIDLTTHPHPKMVAPVRIQRGAFADDMPHTDLLVSPDHAILVDGKLICAGQLINGTTIRKEAGWTSVDYFHVELDRHAILLAEGLPAESYLDTGNRGFFANSGEPLVLHPDLTDETDYPTREAASCAPFVWDETNVRPVWQHLADRAVAIGQPMSPRTITKDPELRLISNQGSIKSVHDDRNLVIFVLPRGSREIRLISRAQSPAEARPWLADRRKLGVRVKRIVLRGTSELREIPMDHPDLTRGWWDIERDGQMMSRWTDGDAVVSLPATDGLIMLELHLAGEMIYAMEAEVPDTDREVA